MCALSVKVYGLYWVVGGLPGIQKLTKKIHHNFGTTRESYTGYDSHSILETTRVRLIPHPYKISYSIMYMSLFTDTFFEIYYSIQYRTLRN